MSNAEQATRARERTSHARDYSPGFFVKLTLMALIDALGAYGLLACWQEGATGIFCALLAILIAANYVYFSKRALAAKYIFPGLTFLLVFQIFVVVYTGYVSFTNYGDGHNSTKQAAIDALLQQNERRVEGSQAYPLVVVERDGDLGFAIIADGEVRVGSSDQPFEVVKAELDETDPTKVSSIDGWAILSFSDIVSKQSDIMALRVPISDEAADGSVRTADARVGYVYLPFLRYDPDEDVMVDTMTDVTYYPNGHGQFQSDEGQTLSVGWRVGVGMENYLMAFSDSRYAKPFFAVLAWTTVYSFASVALCFLVGLFLATILNDPRIKGRRVLRVLLIFPYAIPGFLGALIWTGLLNRGFGFVNQVLLGGAHVGWLTDPWLAKVSVILVSLWLGFPYMFLICTGALQSLPADVMEAAKIDGASRMQAWRGITLPLVFISTAPLLISSFAFNFNNFNLIYMLTGGGPRFPDASVPVGQTDILISMVYSVSGLDGSAQKNYGLASALSIVIFIIVGTVSAIAFRQTRKLEEMI
ncbi:MAG: ABC transporter permease subunit [Propionibacteriaceae bacterium]|jgi:arabinogalactan oligomer/maltooligosaccharide transport system permease protein|nr:ABC transporter permease subunit [Propionibacteriaceae bacterium]